jgi:protein TonB
MKNIEYPTPKWDDLVFVNRNTDYGAYDIRKKYARHLTLAVIITLIGIVLSLAFPAIVALIKGKQEPEKITMKTIKYTDLAAPPPIDKNTPPPPKVDLPPPVKKLIKFLPPKVTEKEVVNEEMPTQEEMKETEVSAETTEGTGEIVFEEPVEEVMDKGQNDNQIFTIVEQMPEYPGGYEAMMKFVAKSMRYPASARRMGIEGTVFVGFVINANGEIVDVQVVKGISKDCDIEAARVIQIMPPWKPGKQNGRPVRVRFVLPIKYKLG